MFEKTAHDMRTSFLQHVSSIRDPIALQKPPKERIRIPEQAVKDRQRELEFSEVQSLIQGGITILKQSVLALEAELAVARKEYSVQGIGAIQAHQLQPIIIVRQQHLLAEEAGSL